MGCLNLWPVLTLLFQGAVAGLIVMFVTKWLDNKKAKEVTRKHAMLLYIEINEHLVVMDRILKHNHVSEPSTSLHLDTEARKSSREHLTGLSLDDLKHLGSYYRSIKQLNYLIAEMPGPLSQTTQHSFEMVSLMARASFYLLARVWDYKNSRIHDEHYREFLAQATAYQEKYLKSQLIEK